MHLKSFRLYPISRGSLAPAGLLFYHFADVGKMENRAEGNPLPGCVLNRSEKLLNRSEELENLHDRPSAVKPEQIK